MATDDAREEGTAPGPAGRPRTGPRHAAPRKPLLTRLHMPAGKAVALAAMPTAVLMGMGFTPQLAQAKPAPKNPFLDGPCVTAPDRTPSGTPSGTASGTAGATPRPDPSGSAKTPGKGPGKDAGKPDGATRSGKPSPPASPAVPRKRTEPGPDEPGTSPSAIPTPTPSAAKSRNPLDPLGLGEKLGEILTGSKSDQGDKAPPGTSPSASTGPSASKSAGPGKPVPPTGTPDGKARPSKKATPAPTPSGSATSSPSPSPSGSADADADADADGSEETPCPSRAVTDENEQHAFPTQPWYLETSKLSLHGLKYEGIKEITMVNGQRKKVLKFTASALDIKDLHQIVNSGGKQYHVTGMGRTSTIRDSKVTMYTEELKGTLNLLGIPTLKVTFSPETPPPLSLPELVFTDVKIRQAGQFGGTLVIPNLHQYLTDGVYP